MGRFLVIFLRAFADSCHPLSCQTVRQCLDAELPRVNVVRLHCSYVRRCVVYGCWELVRNPEWILVWYANMAGPRPRANALFLEHRSFVFVRLFVVIELLVLKRRFSKAVSCFTAFYLSYKGVLLFKRYLWFFIVMINLLSSLSSNEHISNIDFW